MNTEESNSVEKGAHRRKGPVPVRVVFTGAGATGNLSPPTSLCSPEDRVRIRAQLRPTFACRRKMNTEEPNSVEKGAHRRKGPVPVRVVFTGAGATGNLSPPTSLCSPEDRVRIRAQLRPTFACRRKMNTEEPNSVERCTHRRKAPAPISVVFAGGGASVKRSPTASPCSSDERVRICAQLRLVLGNRRIPDHWRHTSCQAAVNGGY